MWGSAPRPGRGLSPLHPVLWGEAPRGQCVWWVVPAFALRSHLGLRPKTPREPLAAKTHFAGRMGVFIRCQENFAKHLDKKTVQ